MECMGGNILLIEIKYHQSLQTTPWSSHHTHRPPGLINELLLPAAGLLYRVRDEELPGGPPREVPQLQHLLRHHQHLPLARTQRGPHRSLCSERSCHHIGRKEGLQPSPVSVQLQRSDFLKYVVALSHYVSVIFALWSELMRINLILQSRVNIQP